MSPKSTRFAFVAGATGYTGREVVRILGEKECTPIAHIRPDSPRLEYWKKYFKELGAEIDTTAWEKEALSKSLASWRPDYVFCLIGTTRKRMAQAKKQGKNPASQSYLAVDYGLTKLLVEAIVSAGIKPRFIYLSAQGVSPNSASGYFRARYLAEQAVIQSGLDYLIVRASFITGKDRDDKRWLEYLTAQLSDILLFLIKPLKGGRFYYRYKSFSNTELAEELVRWGLERSRDNLILSPDQLRLEKKE